MKILRLNLIICVIIFMCVLTFQSYALANEKMVYIGRTTTTSVKVNTTCINGYIFAVVAGYQSVGITQMFERVSFTKIPQPIKCK